MEAVLKLPSAADPLSRRLSPVEITARLARIAAVLPELQDRLDPCTLCPRSCTVHRLRGEMGECGMGGSLSVASVALHDGEEPPVSAGRGAINVFFSGCNLHCLHCQNFPISQQGVGKRATVQELAERILVKWRRGAGALGWVTPTPQLPLALEAYRLALLEGLDLPLVHNGGGYEDPDVVRALAGIVDLWLPDAKTADARRGMIIQDVPDYPDRNLEAIAAMVESTDQGQARVVIVRHLAVPGGAEDSRRVLSRLWQTFGNRIYLSLMAQYFPTYQTLQHPELGRRVSREEYRQITAFARRLGFDNGWIQEHGGEDGIPLHCLP